MCFVWPLVVLDDYFAKARALLLAEDDVLELDHLGWDDGEDGLEVVVE